MLQPAERKKISRMEYKPAPIATPVWTAPKPLFLRPEEGQAPAVQAVEEAEGGSKARIEELEQKAITREQEFAQQLEAARKEAFEQGRQAEARLRASALERIADQIQKAIEEFCNARDGYLAQVEREVVHLALAIAERVLRREVQMDPLLLAGAVRVALGQLAETTEVRMKVPATEYDLWSEVIALMPSLPLRPQLVAEDSLHAGECLLETALGSVDLGVKSQLAEIERGFFDLLEHRERSAKTARPSVPS
jgi:flagellar assembly protein FliH